MSLSSPPQSEIDSILELFSNNNLQEALDKIKTLSKRFPDDSLLHNIRGACYAGLGQLGSAVKSYKKETSRVGRVGHGHGNALYPLQSIVGRFVPRPRGGPPTIWQGHGRSREGAAGGPRPPVRPQPPGAPPPPGGVGVD